MKVLRHPWRASSADHAEAGSPRGPIDLATLHAQRARERRAARELGGSLISLAAILGTDVRDSAGDTVGKLRDIVVHWTSAAAHPRATAIVVRIGRHDAVIGAHWVEASPPATVRLRSTAAYATAINRRPGDVALANDVLDRQLVGADGRQLIRPADVYLAAVEGRIDLIGVEVGPRALLRRLGPKRLRARVRPERVIDWATIRSFSPAHGDGSPARGRRSGLAGQAGAGLALESPAGAVRQLRASDVRAALQAALAEPAGHPDGCDERG